jgi:protein involved in polysaccharide export with SLBB domain
VPVSADYVVGPGDELLIRAWGSIDVDYRATVDRNGQINLPKVGSFNVAGVQGVRHRKPPAAQIGRVFTNFNLSVTLGQLRGVKVFVVGPAQRPGVYTLPSQSTLLSAVVAAGARRRTDRCEASACRPTAGWCPSSTCTTSWCKATSRRISSSRPATWWSSSRWGPRVALHAPWRRRRSTSFQRAGAAERAAALCRRAPVRANQTEGSSSASTATRTKARARRRGPSSSTLRRCARMLRDGDIVTLLQISPQFANAVTLKGHVAKPLRYPYKPGMRISDLSPTRRLVSPDFYRRKNLLVQMIDPDDAPDAQAAAAPGAAASAASAASGAEMRDTSRRPVGARRGRPRRGRASAQGRRPRCSTS